MEFFTGVNKSVTGQFLLADVGQPQLALKPLPDSGGLADKSAGMEEARSQLPLGDKVTENGSKPKSVKRRRAKPDMRLWR